MNTYGKTACPHCNELNSLFRPLEGIREVFDDQMCWNCKGYFNHSEEAKKCKEAETISRTG